MKVRVRCFTGMRRYAPHGKSDCELELEDGASAEGVLERLGVPSDIKPFIAVNGHKAGTDHILREGDEVVVFSHMEGG